MIYGNAKGIRNFLKETTQSVIALSILVLNLSKLYAVQPKGKIVVKRIVDILQAFYIRTGKLVFIQ